MLAYIEPTASNTTTVTTGHEVVDEFIHKQYISSSMSSKIVHSLKQKPTLKTFIGTFLRDIYTEAFQQYGEQTTICRVIDSRQVPSSANPATIRLLEEVGRSWAYDAIQSSQKLLLEMVTFLTSGTKLEVCTFRSASYNSYLPW